MADEGKGKNNGASSSSQLELLERHHFNTGKGPPSQAQDNLWSEVAAQDFIILATVPRTIAS